MASRPLSWDRWIQSCTEGTLLEPLVAPYHFSGTEAHTEGGLDGCSREGLPTAVLTGCHLMHRSRDNAAKLPGDRDQHRNVGVPFQHYHREVEKG